MLLARRVSRVVSTLLLAAGVLFGASLAGPALVGWQRYVITSGSMTGTYDRGSLVLDEIVPVSELRVGDVITYRPPADAGPEGLVTHRIAAITSDPGGRIYRTKGDANSIADPWTFRLADQRQARVRAGIPYAGFVLAALSQRNVRLLLVGAPAAVIAFAALLGLWREAGLEAAGAPQ
jgi:signal peptidase I